MVVIAIDPGPEESAFLLWDGVSILERGNTKNTDLVVRLEYPTRFSPAPDVCAIEQIRGFGVMASDELFDTCHWTGRFLQAFGENKTYMVPRKTAAKHICGVGGISKDSFVREALIAKFGGKDVAVGSKARPGKLYGISSHLWAALAVAITYWETMRKIQPGFSASAQREDAW